MPEYKPEKPNLDLINMVQQARMMLDKEAIPSEVGAVYWIEAKDQSGIAKLPTSHTAQWIGEADVKQVDSIWEVIKLATEQGKLGYKSKVSTASRNQQTGDKRLIVVCTYDKNDLHDIERVRSVLSEIVMDGKWQYQADS